MPITETTDTFQDDYEAEWGEPDNASNSEAQQESIDKTSDTTVASGGEAHKQTPDSHTDNSDETPAKSGAKDIWSEAPAELRDEFNKVQNQYNSMLGRHRAERQRVADYERQLQETQTKVKNLEQETRQPTQFEQDHPDYAKEILAEAERIAELKITQQQELNSQTSQQKAEQDALNTILNAHPDAGELYNNDSFNQWMQNQPLHLVNRLDSTDPSDTIEVLTLFKDSQKQQQQADLNSLSAPQSSSSKPDTRATLTTQEEYEREWELDD
jgi:hypothetical protein